MVASKPSISGMWQSIRMRSKAPLRVRVERLAAVVHDGHAVALDLQDAERHLLVDEVVFDHQDMAAGSAGAMPCRRGLGRRRDRLLGPAGHHVHQAFVEDRLADRLDEAGVDSPPRARSRMSTWRRVSITRRTLVMVGARPDAARKVERIHAGQPEVHDREVVRRTLRAGFLR